jgi:hypothetical protein
VNTNEDYTVEIGGQTMTGAQYDAAQFPIKWTLEGERKGRRLGRIVAAILILAAFLVGALWHPAWAPLPEAHGATKPKVQVRYDVPASQWNVPAAVKASGLPTTKVSKVGAAKVADCSKNCVVVFDVPDRFEHTCAGFPNATLKTRAVLVCKWAPNSATVMLSAPVAKKLTPAQRQAALTTALRSLR